MWERKLSAGAIAGVVMMAGVLSGCDRNRSFVTVEELPLRTATAQLSRARGPVIVTSADGVETRSLERVTALDVGAGGVEALGRIWLRLEDNYYSNHETTRIELIRGAACSDPDANCFSDDRTRQIRRGLATVSWREDEGGGEFSNHSSVADVTLTTEYTVRGLVDGTQGTNCADDANADLRVCQALRSLDCYEQGDTTELICATLKARMFNPLPGRRPEITITAKSNEPVREANEDPAMFFGEDTVLKPLRLDGPLIYRHPAIEPLPVQRHLESHPKRLSLRAALDPGSTSVTEVRLYFTTDPAHRENDFLAHVVGPRDPDTGLVGVCLSELTLGVAPTASFTGTLRFFWRVTYSAGGASDVLQSKTIFAAADDFVGAHDPVPCG